MKRVSYIFLLSVFMTSCATLASPKATVTPPATLTPSPSLTPTITPTITLTPTMMWDPIGSALQRNEDVMPNLVNTSYEALFMFDELYKIINS